MSQPSVPDDPTVDRCVDDRRRVALRAARHGPVRRAAGPPLARRRPAVGPKKQGPATANPSQVRALRSKHTLKYAFVVATDHVGAEFERRYRDNGNCVRDVTITSTSYAPPGPLSGRNLRVETNIVLASEHERGDVAAVVVEIVYHFSNVGGSPGTFVDRFVLFGDGRDEVRTTTET